MTPVIDVRHLYKRYGDTVAVDDVSFSVQPGEIFGILGPERRGQDHHGGVRRGPARSPTGERSACSAWTRAGTGPS